MNQWIKEYRKIDKGDLIELKNLQRYENRRINGIRRRLEIDENKRGWKNRYQKKKEIWY